MFDPKCYELAEHFLPDGADEAEKNALAQEIQDGIELYLFGVDADSRLGQMIAAD